LNPAYYEAAEAAIGFAGSFRALAWHWVVKSFKFMPTAANSI
jgi:hypothetical protein